MGEGEMWKKNSMRKEKIGHAKKKANLIFVFYDFQGKVNYWKTGYLRCELTKSNFL